MHICAGVHRLYRSACTCSIVNQLTLAYLCVCINLTASQT